MHTEVTRSAGAGPTGPVPRNCASGGGNGKPCGACRECREDKLNLQRRTASYAEPSTAPPVVDEVLNSPGRSLDPAARAFMEPRFGHDFSRVQVHTDSRAVESAQAVNARAYTVGEHIVFGAQQYAPDSSAGLRVLAHELTHVVQQSQAAKADRAPARAVSSALEIGPANDAFEQQAEHAAANLGLKSTLKATSVGARRIQRTPAGEYRPSRPMPPPRLMGGVLPYREATELVDCIRIMGPESADLCRHEVLGTPLPPRRNYVFIMGQDRPRSGNPFFAAALRYYRSHIPEATFVTNLRNLADVLSYVATNVHSPIGTLYIVSHANEDGTLAFALDSADPDSRLTVGELRGALHPAQGASQLAQVTAQIDIQTRIHIKGCDIGRTQEMVELLDEAFGGAGTVTAPTHEQEYGSDPTLARRARAAFRAGVEQAHPMPEPVDPALRGRPRQQAQAAHRQALQQRHREIQAELGALRSEEDEAAEQAATFEAFSGPMFQRPGSRLFTAAELQPEVARLYSHLSAAQQGDLVRDLVARDRRSPAQAAQQGTLGQHGQRVDVRRPFRSGPIAEPANLEEANRVLQQSFRREHFRARALQTIQRQVAPDGTHLTIPIEGRFSPPGEDPFDGVFTATDLIPSDAALIENGRAQLPNPGRFAWRVERRHGSNGVTTLSVVAERVMAYLHHGSLDPTAHEHFTRPEGDPGFFATSTFASPPPPPAPTGGRTP